MPEEYQKARKKGEKEYRQAVSEGRYPYLPALDEILPEAAELSAVELGVVEVPLSLFAGTKTVGRQNAFSWGFMPLLQEGTEFAQKWNSLCESQMAEGLRDPVRAYEYMSRFYVEEGNKRVSVLRHLGAYSIPAQVTRILPKRGEPDAEIYYEYLEFYKVTGLFGIIFSEKGKYVHLADVFGRDLEHPWPEEDILRCRSAFIQFSEIFRKKFGERADMTPADAMLLYLQTYSLESLAEGSPDTIGRRIDTLRKEILTDAVSGQMERQETGQEPAKTKGIRAILPGGGGHTWSAAHPLKAAFFYETSPAESRWAYGHELGRNELEENFAGTVVTQAYERCDSAAALREAMTAALDDGAEMFFTTAPGQMPAALRFALDHPKAKVLNCSVNLARNAVRTYYIRAHEAKFLLGILAGSLCEGGRIGYVADLPLFGTVAGINAFAIGAALVRPHVRISLKWASQTGRDWQREFAQENVRLISGPDLIVPASGQREYGLYEMGEDGPVHLAAPLLRWGNVYTALARRVLDGVWEKEKPKDNQAMNYWWGLSADAVDIILSQKLSYYSGKMIDTFRRAVASGELTPFGGELRSHAGTVREAGDPPLTGEEIISMNWLCDNVDGEIPPMTAFDAASRETLLLSGLQGAGS